MKNPLKLISWALLEPIVKKILIVIVQKVLEAETSGAAGEAKLTIATNLAAKALKSLPYFSEYDLDPGELVDLVEAVVAILNTIGLFDDEPGLKFPVFELIEDVKNLVEAIQNLLD